MNYLKQRLLLLLLFTLPLLTAFSQDPDLADKSTTRKGYSSENKIPVSKVKVTFIELGSVRCIPCQQMQTVMKSIETKFGKTVKVIFYDVWTDEGKPYGIRYGIEAIPTQVFLDDTGKEYYRHVGFFPEEELVKVLQMKGVKIN